MKLAAGGVDVEECAGGGWRMRYGRVMDTQNRIDEQGKRENMQFSGYVEISGFSCQRSGLLWPTLEWGSGNKALSISHGKVYIHR